MFEAHKRVSQRAHALDQATPHEFVPREHMFVFQVQACDCSDKTHVRSGQNS